MNHGILSTSSKTKSKFPWQYKERLYLKEVNIETAKSLPVSFSLIGWSFPDPVFDPSRQRTLFDERDLVQARPSFHGLLSDKINPL